MKKAIICFLLMLICIPVYAMEDNFYCDSERVEEMWVTKTNGQKTESYHPYFIKRKSDNKYVYCIEPLAELYKDIKYVEDSDYTKYGLTLDQINKINLIIYYGYGYLNHKEDKWYGITQYLIWKETGKVTDIYFTDKKNGERKDLYQDEIKEIETLIENHNIEPNFIREYNVSVNSELVIDSNINLNDYEITSNADYKIENNKLIFNNLNKGNYQVNLKKKGNRFTDSYLLYFSEESQNVILPGNSNIYNKEYSFDINVLEGTLTLEKISSYNNTKLKGAKYGVYLSNELIKEISTNDEGVGEVNLSFGEYLIKEIEAPNGYKLDTKEYKIIIDENNLDVKMTLYDDKEIIEVPNTGKKSSKNSCVLLIVMGMVLFKYGKKEYNLY